MKLQSFFLALILLVCFTGTAQKNYSTEWLFVNDNDLYLLQYRDSYYTNGFFIQFSKALDTTKQKIIKRFYVGQNMYNVLDRRATWRGEITFDRPYCGYLYAGFNRDKFITTEKLLSYGLEVGVTGDWSLGRQLQDWYHKKLGLFDYPYWQYQIPNAVGITAQFKYATTLWANKVNNCNKKIMPFIEAKAGNFFVNTRIGSYFVWGRFEQSSNSSLLNAAISNMAYKKRNKNELFIYCLPQIIFQGYNATIQGNMFNKPNNIVFTSTPVPIIFQQTFGAVYATPKFTTRIEYIYQTKEAASQLKTHEYISLQGALRF
jgi:hypothetical protein